jgi:hypothetical protein
VARLQYVEGSVSVQPQGVDDWVQGVINRPLTNSDNVWADKNSRAELSLGTAVLRIASETSLTLTNINQNVAQVSLHQGALNVHVRHLFEGETYEIDTPNQAFTILKPGDYRFDVDSAQNFAVVTVWRGLGEASGGGPAVRLKAHEQARFTDASLAHEIHPAPEPDGFDQWCQVRDQRQADSVSSRYVSPDVIGSEDLDAYGSWRDTPEYGNVWVPTTVAPGWAPYTNGNWIWVDPWGWTWEDYAPWGFAPFHYGRWISFGGYWGWAPGPYYGIWSRGWYAPAMVAWFGGPGWGFGFGFGGGFGWCPLGWGEPFFPWYRGGWGYFRGVNVYNARIGNINGLRNGFEHGLAGSHYANLGVRGGFSAVSRNTLEHGLAVNRNMVHPSAAAIRSAPALNRVNADAGPTRDARVGSNASGRAAAPRSGAIARPMVTRMAPPGAARGNEAGSRGAETSAGKPSAGRGVGGGQTASGSTRSDSLGSAASRSSGERSQSSQMAMVRSVPRPPVGSQRYLGQSSSASARGYGATDGGIGTRGVPRPAGPVKADTHTYSSEARSYGGSSGGRSTYEGSYSRGSYGTSGSSRADTSHASSGGGGSSGSARGSTGGHAGGGGGHSGGGHR